MNKGGLSPFVATVLLIFLVISLAAIVFLWASGFFSEQLEKNDESIENQCSRVNIAVDLPEGYGGGGYIVLDIVNNGDITVYGISVQENTGGTSVSQEAILLLLDSGEAKRTEVRLDGDAIDELVIYPVLLGSVVDGDENKKFTCINYPKRHQL